MKAHQAKRKSTLLKISLIIIGLVIAIPICLGMYSGFTHHVNTTEAIIQALEEECNCKSVQFNSSAYGVQFSRNDGVTGMKASYVLKSCQFDSTSQEQFKNLNSKLSAKIAGYADLDIIQFQFVAKDQKQLFIVKNGIIQ